jgi:hypothetical protein
MLVVDGIHKVSLSNGLIRIQVVQAGADGQTHPVEELAIPASRFGQVLHALQNAGQDLQRQIEQQRQRTQEESAPADPTQADSLDFSNP